MEVVPFIEGTRTLEIGHGPGHLNRFLLNRGLVAVAIDESATMGWLAKRKVVSTAGAQPPFQLTRGLAQQLPFRDQSFDTVIATFPTEYITDEETLSEVKRCLSDGGRFVVLPGAMPKSRFLKWLYKVTGEGPQETNEAVKSRISEPFTNAGFDVKVETIELKSSTLWIMTAGKIKQESVS